MKKSGIVEGRLSGFLVWLQSTNLSLTTKKSDEYITLRRSDLVASTIVEIKNLHQDLSNPVIICSQ